MKENKLCECGCGKLTKYNKRKKEFSKRCVGHYERSAETKRKMRDAKVGKNHFSIYNKTKEHSEKVSVHNRTRVLSDKTKQKISKSLIGHRRSEKSKLTQSITMKDSGSSSKENNSSWNNGVSEYKDTGELVKLSKEIKKRDDYTCQKCMRKRMTKHLCVHHIDFSKDNHEPLNLETLCKSCHQIIHRDKRLQG